MKRLLILIMMPVLITASHAALVHSYDFKGVDQAAMLADKTGTIDMTIVGDGTGITMTGDGAVHFDGGTDPVSYLMAPGINDSYNYVVSFWFKLDDVDLNWYDGIVSSDDQKASGKTWQIDTYNMDGTGGADIRLTADGSNTVSDKNMLAEPAKETWHHIAIMAADGWSKKTQYWINGGVAQKFGYEPGDLMDLVLGNNRNLNKAFTGSIANVKIYDGTNWSDADEAAEWANGLGHGVPEPATIVLLGIGSLAAVVRRRRV